MLKIERTVLPSPEQWDAIIRGMRNPKNSWALSDSYITHIEDAETLQTAPFEFFLGEKDHALMTNLAEGGAVHAKYRRMAIVYADITAPLYWWKEFDTYKVGTVANSCSTMHKIHAKEFTIDDFSCEKLVDHVSGILTDKETDKHTYYNGMPKQTLYVVIDTLNACRQKFLDTGDMEVWNNMIQLLPSSYNQKRTVLMNYEVLTGLYRWRRNHKLAEWHTFCDWIESLPHSDLITGKKIVEE